MASDERPGARITRRARLRSSLLSLALVAVPFATSACTTRANYLELDGPRYSADRSHAAPELAGGTASLETVKVVSYNLRYGREVEAAIALLTGTPELADADVILLQEMDAPGVERIADALDFSYVYYPAALRSSGRDFGNAVLTRGRILEDRKVLLPHANPINRQCRIAVRADLELGRRGLQAYSVHTETPFLPLPRREQQIDTLLESVAVDSEPVLIAGDFNTMSARSIARFESAFWDEGFERVSAGIGSTFEIGPFGYEMDHIFARGLEVVRVGKVDDARTSDHVPIWIEFVWSS